MDNLLDAVIVGPADAQYSVIWLHGLGADGYDFEPIVPELKFANKDWTRFIFPHAPTRPVTVNNGYVMRAWYDISEISQNAQEDEAGIRESEALLHNLIKQENQRGVTCDKIILAGFSQGGAIALHTGLRYDQPLSGIMALSTYLPLPDKLASESNPANHNVSIFMAHGEYDPVVPPALAQYSHEYMQAQGYTVDWHTYPMDHSVIPQEIDDISKWLDTRLR